ncbi:MAG: dihydropteroate synthase [Akkermansiaceae bacterium]
MGILNVTPDSFSDGGEFINPEKALEHAQQMIAEGAHIIDVGGESTRPGAAAVSVHDELARVLPVIESLRNKTEVAISIDTSKAEVARAALIAGADIVNDVTGFRAQEMIAVCQGSDCGMVVMHMQGTPRTMQKSPEYRDVVAEVHCFFEEKHRELMTHGIATERVVFDPGIGFGKTLEHNLTLLNALGDLVVEGRPLLMGLSRKSFIAKLTGEDELASRAWPTVALTAFTRQNGAAIHRVHDIAENLHAIRMAESVSSE